MSGVITIMKGITFPSFGGKNVFPSGRSAGGQTRQHFSRAIVSLHQEKVVRHMYSVLMKLSDLSEFCHLKGIDEISAWLAF